jgi:CHAT domain-containing protein
VIWNRRFRLNKPEINMKLIDRRHRFFFIFLLLFLFQPPVQLFSQTSTGKNEDQVAARFDKAAAKHKGELKSLWRMRSAPEVRLPTVTLKTLAALLAKRPAASGVGYRARTAILFYSYEDDALNIWLVDQTGVRAYDRRVLTQEQIGTVINHLRNSLGVESLQRARTPHKTAAPPVAEGSPKPEVTVNQAASAAAEILLPNSIAKALGEVQHLIIVPILGIGTVPFAVLQPFGADSFLIDKMSISVAPSLFDLGHAISHWEPEFSSPLVVGNPFIPPTPDWVIPDLPGAIAEAEAVAAAVNAKPLLRKEATRETVRKTLPQSDFLYFASHGIASADDPLSGGFLLLSANSVENGELTAKEVQDTTLPNTRLVVLSACQTGLGRVHDAGIIGLARAFQIAGAERVVMSLWSVNDQATNELMQEFIKDMKSDIPSEALRKAMIEVKKKRPNPSEWAPFVVFGTPR